MKFDGRCLNWINTDAAGIFSICFRSNATVERNNSTLGPLTSEMALIYHSVGLTMSYAANISPLCRWLSIKITVRRVHIEILRNSKVHVSIILSLLFPLFRGKIAAENMHLCVHNNGKVLI